MKNAFDDLQAEWDAQWLDALNIWSRFTRLRPPVWCLTDEDATREGLTSSFAMIRLTDQSIVINLKMIQKLKLGGFGREIMAHEIGHHVYCPSNLNDDARMIARMRWALPTLERYAGLVSNLYSDLLINDHLQRSADLKIANVYKTIFQEDGNRLWTFYMRIYEILWSVQKGKLAAGEINDQLEGDAQLGARLVRSYSRDWLDGAGRFASLCLPYLNGSVEHFLESLRDTRNSGAGGMPDGLTSMDAGEKEGAIHPSLDPELTGLAEEPKSANQPPKPAATQGGSSGQYRQPFEYGEILKSLGLNLSDHEIAIRYYRERAMRNLVRFPSRSLPESSDPLPEGLEPWDIASSIEDADWFESVMLSPKVIPGLTTVQRIWGTAEGSQPKKQPLDLDLYVDCSGSMPNPQIRESFLTLAGAIIAMSALRSGARVQATLWSGTKQFQSTAGFVRDEHQILQILTGYFGGGTAFPIHILRETYQERKPTDRPAHILIISDEGVDTLYEKDEKGNDGFDIAGMALEKARGGGTMVLNLYAPWEKKSELVRAHGQGWKINPIRSWDELVEFARRFSRATYGEKETMSHVG
jgi:hypothetical protein